MAELDNESKRRYVLLPRDQIMRHEATKKKKKEKEQKKELRSLFGHCYFTASVHFPCDPLSFDVYLLYFSQFITTQPIIDDLSLKTIMLVRDLNSNPLVPKKTTLRLMHDKCCISRKTKRSLC